MRKWTLISSLFLYLYIIINKTMEKLIVKNFGPIKEAEIDLTKYEDSNEKINV